MDKMACPKCKGGDGVVALEDGVWMCTDCTIEFNEDGRTRGSLVKIGEFEITIKSQQQEIIFVADMNVSASAPQKDGTVKIEIKMDSVLNDDELMRKLYESLKRASE